MQDQEKEIIDLKHFVELAQKILSTTPSRRELLDALNESA